MSDAKAMAMRPNLSTPEHYHRVWRQWLDETAYLRNRAVQLLSLHSPTYTFLMDDDGKPIWSTQKAEWPAHVTAELDLLQRQMRDHAVKLGLSDQVSSHT